MGLERFRFAVGKNETKQSPSVLLKNAVQMLSQFYALQAGYFAIAGCGPHKRQKKGAIKVRFHCSVNHDMILSRNFVADECKVSL